MVGNPAMVTLVDNESPTIETKTRPTRCGAVRRCRRREETNQPPQRQNEIFSCENPFQRLLFAGATRIGAASSRFGAFLEGAGKVGC